MKMKTLLTLLTLSAITVNAYAVDGSARIDQAFRDESIVVGACMTVNIQKKVPDIAQDKIEQCSRGDTADLPKCLGVSDQDFLSFVNDCKVKLTNAKCVAQKLKVALIQYADCAYEKDVEACYKGIGTTSAAVAKLSEQCATDVKK